jgi:IS30 family transposase
VEGKRGPECLLKPVSNIDFNPLESQYGIKTYYCHAYTPAERGSNERFNRNLRYFYPKGTRFEHISAQDLTTTLLQINQRTLKILDWQTPYQVMLTNLSKNSD